MHNLDLHINIIFYFENVNFFHAQLGLDDCPEMKPLQISVNTAHSGCKPTSSMPSFTHFLRVFLPIPTHSSSATSTFLQVNTHSYVPDAQPHVARKHLLSTSFDIFFEAKKKYMCVWKIFGKLG